MVSEDCKHRRFVDEEFRWIPNRAKQARRIVSARRGRGVCEGVEKRSFVRPILTKASGKKDRFSIGDGGVKRCGLEIRLPIALSDRP